MNIFVLDECPIKSAQCLVDIHTSKMVLEAAQILSNCFSKKQLEQNSCPKTQNGQARKHSYPHHPCCKWALESRENMSWLIKHAIAADKERMWRRDSIVAHFSCNFIHWCAANMGDSLSPSCAFTPFKLAMPEEFKKNNYVEAYRHYYRDGKKHLHKWTKRGEPNWIKKLDIPSKKE